MITLAVVTVLLAAGLFVFMGLAATMSDGPAEPAPWWVLGGGFAVAAIFVAAHFLG